MLKAEWTVWILRCIFMGFFEINFVNIPFRVIRYKLHHPSRIKNAIFMVMYTKKAAAVINNLGGWVMATIYISESKCSWFEKGSALLLSASCSTLMWQFPSVQQLSMGGGLGRAGRIDKDAISSCRKTGNNAQFCYRVRGHEYFRDGRQVIS